MSNWIDDGYDNFVLYDGVIIMDVGDTVSVMNATGVWKDLDGVDDTNVDVPACETYDCGYGLIYCGMVH